MSTANPSAAPTDPDPAPLHPDPAIAATLEFDPVPGKIARANGWSPEIQRAFIAALAASGSASKAAETVGLALTGAERARDREGGQSFSAAWDGALRVYAAHRRARVNAAVATLQSAIPALPPPATPEDPSAPAPQGPALANPNAIHVVCDSCAATGIAGDHRFAGIPDLLDFDPVPPVPGAARLDELLQRRFVAALAATGSVRLAARAVNRHPRVIEKLRRMRRGRSFSEACDAALELARERELEAMAPALRQAHDDRGNPDELNEHGEYEDQASLEERGLAAVDSIRSKLLGCRRFFLQEICLDPEKRAAWDLLCGPADWEQAAAFEAQPDEAGHPLNFREPDMVTTVASGWLDSSLQRLPGAEEQLLKRIDRMYTAAKEPRFERQAIVPFRQNRPESFGGEIECPPENDDPNAMHVRAEDAGAAREAVAEWQRHVDAGRIGQSTEGNSNGGEADASD